MTHIAINAQLLSFTENYRNAGVSRYTYTLLEALSHVEDDLTCAVFIKASEARATAIITVSEATRRGLIKPSVRPRP